MGRVSELGTAALRDLGLSPEVAAALAEVQQELADAYRERFIEMVQAIQRQASALDRIQTTLALLVGRLDPQLAGEIPPAIRVVGDGEEPDLASAVVVADPIGSGYALSQVNLATAVGLNQPDVSILCKAFKLSDDPRCAVVVRAGKKRNIVNFHPRAVERFRELLRSPPTNLQPGQQGALKRARRKLGIDV